MMIFMMMMSIMFIFSFHPLSAGATLLIQTIMVSVFTSLMSQTPWFSYILFLIMIGAMMILFMYMTSIASNEKFKFNPKIMFMMMLIIPAMITFKTLYKSESQETLMMNKNYLLTSSISKFMMTPMLQIILFLMLYLLLSMIASVKITSFKQGSIRQMN